MLADRLGAFTHLTTLYSSVRPFGASVLLAGYDADAKAAQLYCVEPSGLAQRYWGTALGKGARAAKTDIEKHKLYERASVADVVGPVAKMCVAAAAASAAARRRHASASARRRPLPTPLSPPSPPPQPARRARRSQGQAV